MAEATEATVEKEPPEWWDRFFGKYGETGNVSLACKSARKNRQYVYRLRKEDPEFARRWSEADELGIAALEDEATKRARATSDTLLIFLLKHRAPHKYGDRLRLEYANLSDEELIARAEGLLGGAAAAAVAAGADPGAPGG